MYSITSIFENQDVCLWDELEKTCDYSGFDKATIPHFSWQSAETYQFEPLRSELSQLASETGPFKFKTSGLGIFNNTRKIFFLIIVKNRPLLELHEHIWQRTIQFAEQPNLHYAPENWIPHITLNLNELSDSQFKCSVEELTARPLQFEFEVKEFGFLFLTPNTSGIDSLYPLKGMNSK